MSIHKETTGRLSDGLSGKLITQTRRTKEGKLVPTSKKSEPRAPIAESIIQKSRNYNSLRGPINKQVIEHNPDIFCTTSQRESFDENSMPTSSRIGQQTTAKQSYMESLITAHKEKLMSPLAGAEKSTRLTGIRTKVDKESTIVTSEIHVPSKDHCSIIIAMNSVLKNWRDIFPEMLETLSEAASSDPNAYEKLSGVRQQFNKAFDIRKSRMHRIVSDGEEDMERHLTMLVSENMFLMESVQELIEGKLEKLQRGLLSSDEGVRQIFPDAMI